MQRIKPGVIGRLRRSLQSPRHPKSAAGLLRLWWHDFAIHVPFEGGERCQDCGRRYVLWGAPSDLYVEVHGSDRGLLCPLCFERQAAARGIAVRFEARRLPGLPRRPAKRGSRHGEAAPGVRR